MSLFSPFSSAICNCTAVMNTSPTRIPPCVFFLCRTGVVIAFSTSHPWWMRWRTRLSGMSLSFAVWRCALVSFIVVRLQFDQFLYVKFTFVQIFNRRAFILKSSNIFQCTNSVKAPPFFHAELLFRKSNHINTTFVIMCREINIVIHNALLLSMLVLHLFRYIFSHNSLAKIPHSSSARLRIFLNHSCPFFNRNGFPTRLYNLIGLVREFRNKLSQIFV